MENNIKYALKIATVALTYYAGAYLSLSILSSETLANVIWISSGISLAALLLGGYKLWPGVFLGSLSASLFVIETVFFMPALLIAAGNTLGATVSTYLIFRYVPDFEPSLRRLKTYVLYLIFGAITGPAIAATVGTTTLALSGLINYAGLPSLWIRWWLTYAVGILVIGTLILTFSDYKNIFSFVSFRKRVISSTALFKAFELLALFAILGLIVYGVFFAPENLRLLMFFLMFPAFIWAGARFNPAITSLASFVVFVSVFLGVFYTREASELERTLVLVQMLLALVIIIGMSLAVSIKERDNFRKETLRLNKRLKKEIQARDKFLAMLSHELRNPLVPITNALELLNMKDVKDKEIEEYLNMINRQVKNTTTIVNDLLDVSRIVHGKFELHKKRFDIKKLSEEILKALDKTIKKDKVVFHASLPNKPLFVYADPGRIEQLITNLIINALKYTPNLGEFNLEITQNKKDVVITVKDTGIGIEKEDLEKVFELFTQLNQSMTRTKGGLGVGLMVVKHIAEAHGGKAEVKSEGAGKGAEFTVRLPIAI